MAISNKKLSSIRFSAVVDYQPVANMHEKSHNLAAGLNIEMESICRRHKDVRFIDIKILHYESNDSNDALIIYQVVKE